MSDPNNDTWCPVRCPITQRPFFMWIQHPDLGWVPTYGGPYDSYTIPEADNLPESGKCEWHDIEFTVRRFDHDCGYWVESEGLDLRIVNEETLVELGAWDNEEASS